MKKIFCDRCGKEIDFEKVHPHVSVNMTRYYDYVKDEHLILNKDLCWECAFGLLSELKKESENYINNFKIREKLREI